MITLKHIGARCGVSKATVSLALRDDPRIPETTRAPIKRMADQLGYRLNPLVSAHSLYVRRARQRRSTTVLGYITNWTDAAQPPSKLVNRRCIAGIHARAAELGFQIDHFQLLERGLTQRRLSRILAARGITGAIVADLSKAHKELALDWDDAAWVTIGHALRAPLLHRICHDQYGSMRLLLRELTRRGYQRIGLAMEQRQDERTNHLILGAYLAHQHDHGNAPVVPLLPAVWNREALLPWYRAHRPDIIVSVLEDVVTWLREDGVSIPGDVGFASVCVLREEVPGIHQHFEAIGAAAVDLLATQLYSNRRGLPPHPQTNMIPGEWRDGATVRSLPS